MKSKSMLKKRYKALMGWLRVYCLLLRYNVLRSLIRAVYSRRRKMPSDDKVLTFCFGGIGDVVMSTPFYDNLKSARPGCSIDVVTPIWAAELLEKNCPVIDKAIPYPVNARYMSLAMEWRFFSKLYLESYGTYFCVADYSYPPRIPHNLFGSVVGYVSDIPERIGIYRQHNTEIMPMEKGLIDRAFNKRALFTRHGFQSHGSQMIHEHFRLLELLGIEPEILEPSLHSDPECDKEINRRLKGFASDEDLVVLFNPTSACRYKQWPIGKTAELANRLVRDIDARVVVSGSSGEKSGEILRILMDGNCLDFSGDTALSLPQYVSLAKRSNVCIGLDSGATHIAVALSTPVIMLFGPSPASLFKPLDERRNRVIETPEHPCGLSYCAANSCHMERFCMDYISVDTVYDAFLSIMRQHYPRKPVGT
jgi:heptosyltransferase-1